MPVAQDMEDIKYQQLHIGLPVNGVDECTIDKLEVRQKIKTLMSFVQPSFQADLIIFLKRQLIADFCLRFNFKRVLLATTGHGIASKLLSSLAKGRGSSIANEVSYCGEQLYGRRVTICRPMRDFLQKEIAVYSYSNKIEIIAQKSLSQMQAVKQQPPFFGNTDLIIEGFFNKLQAGFNVHTVPTVIRLTSKLQGTPEAEEGLCALCLGVRDEIKNLLEVGSTISHIGVGVDGKIQVELVKSSDDWFKTSFEQKLCFGCKRLFIESSDRTKLYESLPSSITTPKVIN